jgi:hypothetical protein
MESVSQDESEFQIGMSLNKIQEGGCTGGGFQPPAVRMPPALFVIGLVILIYVLFRFFL